MTAIEASLVGVEYPTNRVSISEIADVSKGEQLNRSGLNSSGQFPVMNGGISPSGWHSEFNRPARVTVVSQGGASAGFVTFMNQSFWAGAHCYVVSGNNDLVLDRYLFHVLKRAESHLQSRKTGAGIPGLNKSVLTSLEIDLPSLADQHEITRVLDTFSALESELEAEIAARELQYSALSRLLLSSENFDSAEMGGTLGDAVIIRNGSDWKNLPSGEIPVYGSGGVMKFVGEAVHQGPSVLIPRKGSIGNIFYSEGPFWTVDTCFYTDIDLAKVQPRFLYHYLLFMELAKLNLAGGVPSLTQSQLYKVPFPRLSLQRQIEISNLLDSVLELIEHKQAGLVTELAARRRQYHFYRDQLLNFTGD